VTDLFDSAAQRSGRGTPLADLARPATLEEVMGQRHLLGPGNLLIESIRKDTLFSMILWGPPGTGKTTIAHVIARSTGSIFVPFSPTSRGARSC
jgi:putative ATPase